MKRTYTAARFFFDSSRRLASLRCELRYWLKAPAWRSEADINYFGVFYRLMVVEARQALRADLARAAQLGGAFWLKRMVRGGGDE